MTFALPLDHILGSPQAAAQLINSLTDAIVEADLLPRDAALRWVCDRVSDCDPTLLAAPARCGCAGRTPTPTTPPTCGWRSATG